MITRKTDKTSRFRGYKSIKVEMYMSKKMNKDVKIIVDSANQMLRTKMMQQNQSDRETITFYISNMLLQKNMYHGFNYFMEKDGMLKLAGKETDLIQFYVV